MIYATFDEQGFPAGFYDSRDYGPREIPVYGELSEPSEAVPEPVAPIIGMMPNPDCRLPADAVEVTPQQRDALLEVHGGRRFVDGEVVAFVPTPPPASVDRERDRRVVAGTTIAVTGIGDVPMTGRPEDQLAILALKDTARDLKAAGVTEAILPYRDRDNATHIMTADQMIEMADAGKAWVQAVYQASWTIKAMDPLPEDVADDGLWP